MKYLLSSFQTKVALNINYPTKFQFLQVNGRYGISDLDKGDKLL